MDEYPSKDILEKKPLFVEPKPSESKTNIFDKAWKKNCSIEAHSIWRFAIGLSQKGE